MRQLARWQPPPTPGWGPISPPTRPSTLWPKVAREVVIFAVLLAAAARFGVLRSPWGLAAVVIARALLLWIRDHRGELPSTLAKWAAAAALGAIMATSAPTLPAGPKARPKAVKVDVAQVDQLDRARELWARAWAKLVAQGGAEPDVKPKGGHR